MSASWFRWEDGDLVLRVRVQPRAAKNELAGLHGDRLKLRLTAPPIDGKANAAATAFLAELCGVPPSQVVIITGAGAREKTFRIHAPPRWPNGAAPPAHPKN